MTDISRIQQGLRYVLVLKDAVTDAVLGQFDAEQVAELLQEAKKPDNIAAREAERVREDRRSQEAAEGLRQRSVDPRRVLHAMEADRQRLGRKFNL